MYKLVLVMRADTSLHTLAWRGLVDGHNENPMLTNPSRQRGRRTCVFKTQGSKGRRQMSKLSTCQIGCACKA